MTREELCNVIGLPAETPSAGLVQARAERVTGLQSQLREDGLPKPVKIKLTHELMLLESREAAELTAQLEIMGQIEGYFAEIDAELAKPNPARGVVTLCLEKLKPLVPGIKDEPVRFGFEKRIAGVLERPMGRVEAPPPPGSRPPVDAAGRIEAYLVEIASELAKPQHSRGVIRLCLDKLKPLMEQVPDEEKRFGFERRVVEIEDRLGWRQTGYPFRPVTPAGSKPPPVPPPEKKAPEVPLPSRDADPVAILPVQEKKSPPPPEKKTEPWPGMLLQLLPARLEGTLRQMGVPIHLVARPRFLLGRKRAAVDFVAWFLPENAENQEKTDTISQIHTTFSLKGSQIMVQDGRILDDGKGQASTNGTVIDGQSITAAAIPLNFAKERRLRLGQFAYELSVSQLPAVAPEGPLAKASEASLSTMPTVVLPKRPLGCLRFLPLSCSEVRVMAVWMFSEATLGSGAQCAVKLDAAGLPPVAVRFHHWQGGFWLEVPFDAGSVASLDGRRLAAGDVWPLQAAHEFRLGELSYDLRIS